MLIVVIAFLFVLGGFGARKLGAPTWVEYIFYGAGVFIICWWVLGLLGAVPEPTFYHSTRL